MDRRQFVAGASIGVAAAASAFPTPAIAQGVRELKMVTTWPKTLPGLQSGAERVAEAITSLSGGRLNVKVFAAGQLVGAFESFDAVSSGLADMYHSSEITWAGHSPAFSYFCNVPFGFTPPEINAWIYHGGGQALWDELSAGFGCRAQSAELNPDRLALCGAQHRLSADSAQSQHAGDCRGQSYGKPTDRR